MPPRPRVLPPLLAAHALFAASLLIGLVVGAGNRLRAEQPAGDGVSARPNFVVIFIDDMGYGDIQPYGSRLNDTPALAEMASQGMKLTSFYAAPVCSASRAQLLTGCYAPRVSVPGVFFPAGPKGLNPEEVTVAEYLREAGYATACIGKWHLGDQPSFLPTNQGFDRYFGIPYSNDMQRPSAVDGRRVVPLLRDDKVADLLDDEQQRRVTKEYTEEAVRFLQDNQSRPFFLYMPHTAMHVPLFPHESFVGKSRNGTYGDWVAEVDASVATIMETLRTLELAENTLVLFTTDNGPWASKGAAGGVSGPLRGSKGCTLEGGVRVPTIAWWPGKIAPNTSNDAVTGTTDILPTLLQLAGVKRNGETVIDGIDISKVLLNNAALPDRVWHYYQGTTLKAVRRGPWKLAIAPQSLGMGIREKPADLQTREPRLYNLEQEIGETTNLASDHPQVVADLLEVAEAMKADIGSGQAGPGVRPAGVVQNPTTLYPTTARPTRSSKPIDWTKVEVGKAYPSAALGTLTNREFTIALQCTPPKGDAILLAHGGAAVGYGLYVQQGEVVFTVRTSAQQIARVKHPFAADEVLTIVAKGTGRGMELEVNGKQAGGDFRGVLPRLPQEDFCVGHDNKNPVDPEAATSAYRGKILKLNVSTRAK